MKRYIKVFVSSFLFVFLFFGFFYETQAVYVKPYVNSHGTYVSGHQRTSPDGNPYNNYSYPGNYNPNTGSITGGSTSTYLNNYYNNSSSSFGSSLYPSSYLYSGSSLGASPSSYEEVKGGYKSYGILFCDYNYYESGDKCIKAPKNSTASYSSFRCDYGYVKDGKECIELPVNAEKSGDSWKCKLGYNKVDSSCMAVDNSYIKSDGGLSCKDGYHWNEDGCYTYTQNCQLNYGRESYGDKDYCYCNQGYEWNSDKTKCVQSIICSDNEVSVGGKCISLDESCQKTYGIYSVGVIGSKKPDGNASCKCNDGYSFTTTNEIKSCTKNTTVIQSQNNLFKALKFGSYGDDVKKLQIKLVEKGLLTATPNGNFGPATLKAIKIFQANNGLTADGIVTSPVLELINK